MAQRFRMRHMQTKNMKCGGRSSQRYALHAELVSEALNEVQAHLALDQERIPQLGDVNRALKDNSGFHMEPVAGLVDQDFLGALADRVFLSLSIFAIIHALYTPEPDVVHELVGHAASLIHPDIVALSVLFGQAARRAGETASSSFQPTGIPSSWCLKTRAESKPTGLD